MLLQKHEFDALQKHWYKRLADSGFKDIENENGLKEFWIDFRLRKEDHNKLAHEAEYFHALSCMANNDKTVFRNEIDRYILVRYSEGAKISIISRELVSRGTSRDRKSIRTIIRKYEMCWGIKN